jgi:hypothetical protein
VCSSCDKLGNDCLWPTVDESETRHSALKRKHEELEEKVQYINESNQALRELLTHIRTRPEAEAASIFKKIRDGEDVRSVVRQTHDADLLLQLQLEPETRYRYDFVFPYNNYMPQSLRTEDNPYLSSLVYEATFAGSGSKDLSLSDKHQPQYLKPYLAASVMDPRIELVRPSTWTSVSDDDNLMRSLLKIYFLHEYPLITCFHKDYFLDDMISGSTEFCSSLLVNCILAQACVSATSVFRFI